MALTRKGQVYSVGNYLMTGKVLGKGHFAKVEEATHRVIGKKVAIKIIDLTCIKEDYARRNLHREPRVMAKLRHPCIAALYETMMHGPRLYVVMEAAGGGDLCAHVLAARGAARGLPEPRARALAAQLVSAVRHMHARGVVHRDLKMENIMLDSTKQFIKIVDFGLSNVWCAGAALRTPCGSLEYAAPELFVDGRRYGPEVDLWSIGVIVYGMVTGGLPFAGNEETAAGGATAGGGGTAAGGGASSRPQLRAAIARGFSRKQRAALACASAECKLFIQQLLEPKVELRMRIEEAARHRWVKRAGMRMKTHPLPAPDARAAREIYRQISELSGQPFLDVVAQIKAEPFGATGGMYNIKTHLQQLQAAAGPDLLWSAAAGEPRPPSPPPYRACCEPAPARGVAAFPPKFDRPDRKPDPPRLQPDLDRPAPKLDLHRPAPKLDADRKTQPEALKTKDDRGKITSQDADRSRLRPPSVFGSRKPVFKVYETGDGPRRLPSIHEASNPDLTDRKGKPKRPADEARLNSCPNRPADNKRTEFYRRGGDGLPSWRASGAAGAAPRILLQTNATTIKRASLGNIVSPHSSSNSHCKSERAMPVGWFGARAAASDGHGHGHGHGQRLRRTAPIK